MALLFSQEDKSISDWHFLSSDTLGVLGFVRSKVLFILSTLYVNRNHKKEKKTTTLVSFLQLFKVLKLIGPLSKDLCWCTAYCIAITIIHRTNLGLQTKMQIFRYIISTRYWWTHMPHDRFILMVPDQVILLYQVDAWVIVPHLAAQSVSTEI